MAKKIFVITLVGLLWSYMAFPLCLVLGDRFFEGNLFSPASRSWIEFFGALGKAYLAILLLWVMGLWLPFGFFSALSAATVCAVVNQTRKFPLYINLVISALTVATVGVTLIFLFINPFIESDRSCDAVCLGMYQASVFLKIMAVSIPALQMVCAFKWYRRDVAPVDPGG